MFKCSFCSQENPDEGFFFTKVGLCPTCEKVHQISKIYGMKAILDTLNTIYIRDEQCVEKRTELVKGGASLRSHPPSYPKVKELKK